MIANLKWYGYSFDTKLGIMMMDVLAVLAQTEQMLVNLVVWLIKG